MSAFVISATSLARRFSDFLNQVHYQGITLEVKRGNTIVAQLAPPKNLQQQGFPVSQLDSFFSTLPALEQSDRKDFLSAIKKAKKQLVTDKNIWDS